MDPFVNNLVATFSTELAGSVTDAVGGVAGHSGAFAAALTYLLGEPGIGLEELRAPLLLSQPASVRLLRQLTDAGLVTRTADREDGRRVQIHLTAKGRQQARAVLAARSEVIATFLSVLTDAEQQQLAEIAAKVLAEATRNRADAERLCRLCDLRACPESVCPVELAAASGRGLPSDPAVTD